ncbi:MAG TPA: YicC family protein [Bacteroidales bacterium]|nr:YicC family protein [Bacteroidales bacterium]HCI55072.1 YicC family protein [Bacteroidales bacterium]HQG35779.1 YicC family protein [Bacteroidales bacterium]HQG52337.1 YicC family protein [Bacteroidales bacterium]HRC88484.1 YicC family protein [Bacteroidales bacterium]
MIKSMTGFGKATAETSRRKITVEIRSLNSKQLDIVTRLPLLLRDKEPEIRNILSQSLERGKIDIAIFFDAFDNESFSLINKPAIKSYYAQMTEIAEELGIELTEQALISILRLPDTLHPEKQEIEEEDWKILVDLINEAINVLDRFRIEEGKALEKDIVNSINKILKSIDFIQELEPARIEKERKKLVMLLEENIQPDKIDKNRLEQEIIYYIEKLDINEEKVRLKQHCDYFLEMLSSPSSNGKLLGFIAQEIGREINTIGSKANDVAIQKIVVNMKNELEKVKEQLLNIL